MKKLNVVIDVSGSMSELGKIHIQRNLCCCLSQLKSIDQEKYADFDMHFHQWAQNISQIRIQNDGKIPTLNAEGSSSLTALLDFISQNVKHNINTIFLILSDGNFSNSEISTFKNHLSPLSDLIIRTVGVGSDADLLKLKKISTNSSAYFPENIIAAIDCTLFRNDEQLTAPVSTDQIPQFKLGEQGDPVGDWEDWDA